MEPGDSGPERGVTWVGWTLLVVAVGYLLVAVVARRVSGDDPSDEQPTATPTAVAVDHDATALAVAEAIATQTAAVAIETIEAAELAADQARAIAIAKATGAAGSAAGGGYGQPIPPVATYEAVHLLRLRLTAIAAPAVMPPSIPTYPMTGGPLPPTFTPIETVTVQAILDEATAATVDAFSTARAAATAYAVERATALVELAIPRATSVAAPAQTYAAAVANGTHAAAVAGSTIAAARAIVSVGPWVGDGTGSSDADASALQAPPSAVTDDDTDSGIWSWIKRISAVLALTSCVWVAAFRHQSTKEDRAFAWAALGLIVTEWIVS